METWQPKVWTGRGAVPDIPVLDGKVFSEYAAALIGWGISGIGEVTDGAGYGDQIAVITDPATGAIGVMTHWQWNSRVEWHVWTPDGYERRGKADTNLWTWDAVKTVRHLLAHYAFSKGRREGQTVSYWAES